jgi:hypothetical protein
MATHVHFWGKSSRLLARGDPILLVFRTLAYPDLLTCHLDVLDGYNGTVFAYGQTGSGKTFTMMASHCHLPLTRLLIDTNRARI